MAEKSPPVTAVGQASPVDEALALVHTIAEQSAIGLGADSAEAESSAFALERAISQAELSDHLRVALAEAASRSSDSMEALRVAVCAFTLALRDEGVSPEAVLIRLKTAIRKQTLIPLWENSTWGGPTIHETMSTWCIQDYFGDKRCRN